MTLGEIVKAYRLEHGMSQRQFASRSGLSNSYVSMLEQNMNSKNGQPIIPSLVAIKKVADAMCISVDSLLYQLGETEIDLTEEPTAQIGDELDKEIIKLLRELPVETKESLLDLMRKVAKNEGRK